jgi:CRISPR/Cas system CSM-associated protein Csm3 (group 7 of RAMP superfamily)
MSLYKIELALVLALDSPLHIGTGYGLAGYLDARTRLDEHGYPYLPGPSLKGRLRFYLHALLPTLNGHGSTEAEVNLFGQENEAGSLCFNDLRLTWEWQNLLGRVAGAAPGGGLRTERRTNVMLSRLRGVALEKHLFTVETAPPHLNFEGRIHGYLPDCSRLVTVGGRSYPRDLALLLAACRALTHLGGRKSRGLGRCGLTIAPDGLLVDGNPVDSDQLLEALR